MHSRTHLRGRARLIMEPVGVFLVNTTMGIIGCGTASSPGARGTSGSGRDTMSAVATADEEIFPAGAEDGNVSGNEEPDITQGSDDEFSDYAITATQDEQDPSAWKFEVSSKRGSVRNELFFVWESEGESYTGRNVSHTFSRAGTHLITVTGSNAKGAILFVLTLEVTIPVFNQAPIANCGPDETVEEGTMVLLSGVGSYDPDEDGLTYIWAQGNGPPVELLENQGVTTSFVAPTVDEDIDLTITLTVSDGEFSSQDSVRVYVVDLVDTASVGPMADAGPDQSVIEAGSVTLDGSQSSSENGGSLSFEWFQFSGSSVALSNPGAAVTTFAAPAVAVGETATLEFELIVTEGGYLSASDEVTVTVEPDASGDGGSGGGGGDPPSGCASDADCDDGDSCNGGETCQSGACVSGTPMACDDGDVCNGVEACQTGVCVSGTAPTCDDGIFCNGLETCDTALGCQAGAAVNCDDGVSCTVDSCNEATDSCDNSPNDAICDDGQYCNGVETCHSTLDCQAGTVVYCDDGVACTDDACNEGTDSCDNSANDAICDDGQYCNGAETCHATLDCQVGTAVNCDDGVACTNDSCNEGSDSCDNVPNDSLCDNGSFCDGSETCDAALGCQAGGDPCPAKDCNEGTDSCEDIACAVDADCDDGLWCNGAESCASGTCQAGTAPNCDDGVGCTDDSCNESTDSCDRITNNTTCDNGQFCDGAETCHATLNCQSGSNPCPGQVCDEAGDVCVDCLSDADCDDGVACTVDSCNTAANSCGNAPNHALCDNGLFCDGTETCNPVAGCQVGSDPCAGDPCHEDTDTCGAPAIAVSTASLDFGLTESTLDFEVWNSGGGTLTYTAAPEAGVAWLSVTPTAGSSTGEHDTLAVTVDRTGLTDGNYQADIIVTPSGGSPILIAATIAVVAAPPVTLDESFENYSCAENPLGWVDTGPNNSLIQDDSLFSVQCPSGNKALGTSSTATNIHSHYTAPGSLAWSSYTYSGRMMIAQSTGGVGVTFLSDFTSTDAYYRLRRFDLAGSDSFHIDPHGTSITAGTTDTGVVPTANQWYRFSIEVADTGSRTEIKAKVWPDGSPEPASWQVDCYDSSGSRRTAGTVGVWSMGGGAKYWDDFRVYQPNCEIDTDNDGVVDCQDGCPQDGNKTAPGICGCGVSDTVDTDGDTVPDCIDQCPGAPDVDTDGDGVPDCVDQCPGAPDLDSDGDGTMDCNDGCPNDANKTVPGVCGCGVADADSDGDGTRDCSDGCPTDPNKTAPGVCGCNRSDVDESGNPILDPANCPAGQTTSSITQYGITWTFDGQYEFGQFVNGDYWAVGPIGIVSITSPLNHGHPGRDGSMVNPLPGSQHGYDDQLPGYVAGLNVGLSLPLNLNPNESLISTITWDPGDPGSPPVSTTLNAPRPTLRKALILTCLVSAPPDGTFRPPYAGNAKPLYSTSQLRRDRLPRLPHVSNMPTIASLERKVERVWLDHYFEWIQDYHHPSENMEHYGRELASEAGDISLMLMLDFSDEEKETLLIRFVQLGIDFYGLVNNGQYWPANGGVASGRKWPILFAGLLLNDLGMLDIGSYTFPISNGFGEDCQTYYSSSGVPAYGIRHCNEGNNDQNYRTCCTGNVWSGHVLSARIMSAKEFWNHDALFDYQDNYMDPSYPGSFPVGDWHRAWSDFAEEMWDTYRADYP